MRVKCSAKNSNWSMVNDGQSIETTLLVLKTSTSCTVIAICLNGDIYTHIYTQIGSKIKFDFF